MLNTNDAAIVQSFSTLPCAVSKYCHGADMSHMTSYNSHQIHECAVPIQTCLIQPTMIFTMQHCAISSGSTARLVCFNYTVNSFIVYHRRRNFHLVLRVVHAAYFLQKMAHVGLGEIYLQGALGFCESVF